MIAARALANIGPDAKSAIDALTNAEKDDDANVKQLAAAALAQIRSIPDPKDFLVKGVLTPVDSFDRIRQNTFHVVHAHQMKSGVRYQIDLTSTWSSHVRVEHA